MTLSPGGKSQRPIKASHAFSPQVDRSHHGSKTARQMSTVNASVLTPAHCDHIRRNVMVSILPLDLTPFAYPQGVSLGEGKGVKVCNQSPGHLPRPLVLAPSPGLRLSPPGSSPGVFRLPLRSTLFPVRLQGFSARLHSPPPP